jgi:tRNA-(ms[2]io[6]A)-hydroxylase
MKLPDLSPVNEFLGEPTPREWVEAASIPGRLPQLLSEHADLEQKAAQSALTTIRRYAHGIPGRVRRGEHPRSQLDNTPCELHSDLLNKMSRLAREELRHFEQVLAVMVARGITYQHVSSSRYAGELRAQVRSTEPDRLVDTLIAGAFIEARSCERFAVLAPYLDHELGRFYQSLLKSESRHFQDYLTLAARYSLEPVEDRIARFRDIENALILGIDDEFRFHSGRPSAKASAA